MKPAVYAVYRGDEFLCHGTSYQLAKKFGVAPKTVHWWASPANRRKADKPGHRRKYAVRI